MANRRTACSFRPTASRSRQAPTLSNFGPRIGFAYQVNNKLVIRGGAGLFYDRVAANQFVATPVNRAIPTPSPSTTWAPIPIRSPIRSRLCRR